MSLINKKKTKKKIVLIQILLIHQIPRNLKMTINHINQLQKRWIKKKLELFVVLVKLLIFMIISIKNI